MNGIIAAFATRRFGGPSKGGKALGIAGVRNIDDLKREIEKDDKIQIEARKISIYGQIVSCFAFVSHFQNSVRVK